MLQTQKTSELLAAPLAEEDKQSMEETEIILPKDLSGLIEKKVPPAQVGAADKRDINQMLDQAKQPQRCQSKLNSLKKKIF